MDQGLKERLIGAAVLTVLAVWLIPWLLDGPDEPIVDERAALELPVPSGHVGELRTEVIDLSARRDAGAPTAASAQRDPAPAGGSAAGGGNAAAAAAARIAPPATSSGSSDSNNESPAAATAPAGAGSASDRDERAAASPPAERPASGSDASAAGRSDTGALTASASAASRSGSSSAAAVRSGSEAEESGDWAVQLGSFGEEENARRHADRISTFGYSPKISTFRAGGRVMYRVRVGPHATRQAAEAAASALAAHGFVAQVVTTK